MRHTELTPKSGDCLFRPNMPAYDGVHQPTVYALKAPRRPRQSAGENPLLTSAHYSRTFLLVAIGGFCYDPIWEGFPGQCPGWRGLVSLSAGFVCSACAQANKETARFCRECGSELDPATQP